MSDRAVWIITRFKTNCAECDEELPRGTNVLWLPDAPRDQNNYCVECGVELAGSYPPPHYWQLRRERFEEENR